MANMAFDDREEKEVALVRELPAMYRIPSRLKKAFQVEINPKTLSLINIGDDPKWVLDEKLAERGQRYVAAFFIKGDEAHFRAFPSFDRVMIKKDREEFTNLIKHIAKHFSKGEHVCDEEEVVFPDNKKYTGIVHGQLRERIIDLEPEVAAGATIVALSVYKKNGVYYWENRSAFNSDVFSIDPLALACFAFDEECLNEPNPSWDRFYHLRRSVPADLFSPLVETVTKDICGDEKKADVSRCTNFPFEEKWNALRKKFQSHHAEAVKEIQEMLMKNLYLFLTGKTSYDDIKGSIEIILEGFKTAEGEYGIPIDFDLVPKEFKNEKKVMDLMRDILDGKNTEFTCEKDNVETLLLELNEYMFRKIEGPICEAMKENRYSDALELFKKLDHSSKGYQYLFTPEMKELYIDILSDEDVLAGKTEPNYSKVNKDGENMLQLAAKAPLMNDDYLQGFLEFLDLNVLDKDGFSPLYYVFFRNDVSKCELFLREGADPYLKGEHGKSAFDVAVERYQIEKKTDAIELLLDAKFKLPKSGIINDAVAEIIYKKIIDKGINHHSSTPVYYMVALETLLQSQTDPEVFPNLQYITLKILKLFLEKDEDAGIRSMLSMDMAELKLSDDFDKKKIEDGILNMLEKHIEDDKYIVEFFERIKERGNQLAQKLLESADFKAKLTKYERKANLSIRKENFLKLVKDGYFQNAENELIYLSKLGFTKEELLTSLEDPFMKHLAGILMDEKEQDFNKKNNDGKSLLYLVCEDKMRIFEKNTVIRGLLKQKANVTDLHEDFKKHFEQKNINEMKKIASYIHTIEEAAKIYILEVDQSPYFPKEFLEYFNKTLAEEKPNFNKQFSYDSKTLLHILLEDNADLKLLEAFLKFDIDPNVNGSEGTPLHVAMRNHNRSAVKMLLEYKSDLYKQGGWSSPINFALSRHEEESDRFSQWLIQECINQFPDFYAKDLARFEKEILHNLIWLINHDNNFLDVILNKIKLQSNDIIKTQLNNLVIRLLDKNEITGYYNDNLFLKILTLTKDQYQLSPDIDYSKLVDTIIDYLDKSYDKKMSLKVIDALGSNSAISDALHLSKEAPRLYDHLYLARENIAHQKNIDSFKDLAERGNFDDAKEYLYAVPKELIAKISNPLLRHLATILKDEKPNFHLVDEQGRTLFHLLANTDYLPYGTLLTEALLKYNINPNVQDKDGNGALYYALNKSGWFNLHTAQQLIALKAEFQAEKKYDSDILEKATTADNKQELALWLIKNNFKYSDDFVNKDLTDIEKLFNSLIDGAEKEKLPEVFEAIEILIKNHNIPSAQKILLFSVYRLFNDCFADEDRIDANKIQLFLQLDLKISADMNIDISGIRMVLYSIVRNSEQISDEDRMKIVNTILDPTSYIGKQLLKAEPSMGKFSSRSKLDATKFRDGLIETRTKLLEEKQDLRRKS